jgi:hypothetical protein
MSVCLDDVVCHDAAVCHDVVDTVEHRATVYVHAVCFDAFELCEVTLAPLVSCSLVTEKQVRPERTSDKALDGAQPHQ